MNSAPTLVIGEEFGTLERFDEWVAALARDRGFGVRFMMTIQSASQLELTYGPSWKTIPGLCGAVQYFGGTGDEATANLMSSYSGTDTIKLPSGSEQTGPKHGGTNSESLTGRVNKMPDEVMRLPLPNQLVSYIGVGMVEARTLHPSLVELPEYSAFMRALEEGYSVEQAELASRITVHPAPARPAPSPPSSLSILWEKLAKLNATLSVNPFKLFDRVLAVIMGDDLK
jgi:hypothetical protein